VKPYLNAGLVLVAFRSSMISDLVSTMHEYGRMNRQFGTGGVACQVPKSIGAKSWPSSGDIGSWLARFDAIQSVFAMGG
jgi:hypothetical protein